MDKRIECTITRRFKRTGNNGLLVVHSPPSRLNAGPLCFFIVMLLCLITNARGEGWQFQGDASNPIVIVDYSPGFSYVNPIYHRYNQNLFIYFGGNPVLRVDVRPTGENDWITIHDGGPLFIGVLYESPWQSPGSYELEIRYWDETPHLKGPFKHDVFAVDAATHAFRDEGSFSKSLENRMAMWGPTTIEKPVLIVEGFDPANENNPALYYKEGGAIVSN